MAAAKAAITYQQCLLLTCYGPEFVANDVRAWIEAVGAKTAYIELGSPWENGYCESFNARLRDELLDGEIFYSLREAQILIEQWRKHYNTKRPLSALGYRPPTPETLIPVATRPVMHSQSNWTSQIGLLSPRHLKPLSSDKVSAMLNAKVDLHFNGYIGRRPTSPLSWVLPLNADIQISPFEGRMRPHPDILQTGGAINFEPLKFHLPTTPRGGENGK